MKLISITTITLLAIFISCAKEPTVQEEATEKMKDYCDTITYSNTIQRIMENNCVACHDASSSQNFTSYETVKAKANRIFIRAVETETMPPNESAILSQEDQDAITCWNNSGQKE